MIVRGIALAVAAIALLHGYFYVAFGTLDPCAAATFRLINQERRPAVKSASLVFSTVLDNALRSKGVLTCYVTAVTGEEPKGLL